MPAKIPAKYKPLIESIKETNNQFSKWHGEGYKGAMPPSLVEAIADLSDVIDVYQSKEKKNG